ncbi:hypothetical protein ROZALSC1DRAFT_24707, partial [Rozella allomycis CSF55]
YNSKRGAYIHSNHIYSTAIVNSFIDTNLITFDAYVHPKVERGIVFNTFSDFIPSVGFYLYQHSDNAAAQTQNNGDLSTIVQISSSVGGAIATVCVVGAIAIIVRRRQRNRKKEIFRMFTQRNMAYSAAGLINRTSSVGDKIK